MEMSFETTYQDQDDIEQDVTIYFGAEQEIARITQRTLIAPARVEWIDIDEEEKKNNESYFNDEVAKWLDGQKNQMCV